MIFQKQHRNKLKKCRKINKSINCLNNKKESILFTIMSIVDGFGGNTFLWLTEEKE